MFIKDNDNLPPNVIWFMEKKAKRLLRCFPEIARRVNSASFTEIGFVKTPELLIKVKDLKID